MPELRQNFFTKEWVVIATERAKRPEQLIADRPPRKLKSFVLNCPFCPGNENLTPPEILRVPSGDGAWKIRVVPTNLPPWRVRFLRHGRFIAHEERSRVSGSTM